LLLSYYNAKVMRTDSLFRQVWAFIPALLLNCEVVYKMLKPTNVFIYKVKINNN
jgi:hypothetical protein